MRLLLGLVLAIAAPAARADLEAVKTEQNLEKRSEKALSNANKALDGARKAYRHGEMDAVQDGLAEVRDSVILCQTSLQETGKDARRNPKYFKRAEIGTRKLLRRLDNFRLEMAVAERPPVESVIRKVQQIHDELLAAIMSKKR